MIAVLIINFIVGIIRTK